VRKAWPKQRQQLVAERPSRYRLTVMFWIYSKQQRTSSVIDYQASSWEALGGTVWDNIFEALTLKAEGVTVSLGVCSVLVRDAAP
jgi:hypothetical protein